MTATADALMAIFGFKRVEGNQMKTDRELLELAAKAAGIVGVWHERGQCIHVTDCEGMSDIWWRPLTDDGDALRLAVRCKIAVNPMTVDGLNRDRHESTAGCVKRWTSCIEMHDGDPLAATRRAIVRAAAAIGEGMQ